jgi:hypothetical protein
MAWEFWQYLIPLGVGLILAHVLHVAKGLRDTPEKAGRYAGAWGAVVGLFAAGMSTSSSAGVGALIFTASVLVALGFSIGFAAGYGFARMKLPRLRRRGVDK